MVDTGREGAPASVDHLIDAHVAAAALAWPAIIGDEVEFRQRLRAHADAAPTPTEAAAALAALCTDDLWLALACARGDTRALAAFDARYLSRVPMILARHHAQHAAEEVRQRLREHLLVTRADGPPRIGAYSGRGALGAWLRVVTLRLASNFMRAEPVHAELDDGAVTAAITDALADVPELRVLEGAYRVAFREAFRGAFAALAVDERTLLKLHFVDGVTVRALAPILGVSPATAGRRLLGAQGRLGELTLARLGAHVQATPSELASVVRALVSRLDVSLTSLL